jgi:hypothetical protein
MSSSKKKKVVSEVAPVAPESTTPASVASVNPIPTTVSAPPDAWIAPERLGRKGRRPKTGLTLVAPDLVAELRTSAPALLAELGTNAVDPQQLAAALDTAHAWTGVAAKATAFNTYARSQRGTSWDAAMKLMNGMQLGVRYALARDGTFADRFPEVAKAFAPKPRPKKSTTDAVTTAAPKTGSRKKSASASTEPTMSTATPATPAAPAPQAAPGTPAATA